MTGSMDDQGERAGRVPSAGGRPSGFDGELGAEAQVAGQRRGQDLISRCAAAATRAATATAMPPTSSPRCSISPQCTPAANGKIDARVARRGCGDAALYRRDRCVEHGQRAITEELHQPAAVFLHRPPDHDPPLCRVRALQAASPSGCGPRRGIDDVDEHDRRQAADRRRRRPVLVSRPGRWPANQRLHISDPEQVVGAVHLDEAGLPGIPAAITRPASTE